MAKKRTGRGKDGVNKSAAIREMFEQHGLGVPAKDVITALAARNITVSSAHVSNERTRQLDKNKKQRGTRPGSPNGRRGRGPGRPAVAASVSSMADTLLEAKRLADLVGGVEEARRALDLLAKLQK